MENEIDGFKFVIMEKQIYKDAGLDVEFYPNFILAEEASEFYRELDKTCVKNPIKRVSKSYGEVGLKYVIHWYGKTTVRELIPWETVPLLLAIKDRLNSVVPEEYNTVVVQKYPTGKIGINPHRDKEMKHGTVIAGVSLGETRTLTLERNGKKYSIPLNSGSLYVLKPPTNDKWSHCIEQDSTTKPRISLTYRNYR